jgi:hypothetical protein
MRIIRVAITALLSLGLVLSPVAAGMAQAHIVKCEQMMSTQHDDCGCCGDTAACSSSACVAQCFNTQAGLTTDTGLMPVSREKLRIDPSAFVRSLTVSPDPPHPRS